MTVGIIGLGSMGGMLARAFLRGGEAVWVANRSQERVVALRKEFPAAKTGDNAEVARRAEVVFICVHTPEMLGVIDGLRSELRAEQTLVIIANSLPLAMLAGRVPCTVAKVIPTVTQEAGGGTALLMFLTDTPQPQRESLRALLAKIGGVTEIPEELGRACASLSSAGPALLAKVLQEMAAAATVVDPRLGPARAWELVLSTAAGTAAALKQIPAEELIHRVATPGGMTAAGLDVLQSTAPEMWRTVLDGMRRREAEMRQRMGLPDTK
jgi:pyrroline-5-carboxylate reductase